MAKIQRKFRRRWIPKLLLLLAYTIVIVFLSALFFMKNELRRVGFFNTDRQAEEITRDDKKQLDDILRAREGK
jgi:hypothetical protein